MTGLMRTVLVMCGAAAVMLANGCSSDSGGRTTESKKAITSLADTRAELVKAKAEVNDANSALDKLAAGGGSLEQTFKQYTAAVNDVKAAGDRARARAQAMRNNARAYVAKWEKEMDQVSSPELRAGAAARRQKVKDNFDAVQATGRSVRDAYQPFLKNLQDIQRALASDLTPAGVDAARPAIEKAKTEGVTLNQRLDALIEKLDDISSGMSTASPAASR